VCGEKRRLFCEKVLFSGENTEKCKFAGEKKTNSCFSWSNLQLSGRSIPPCHLYLLVPVFKLLLSNKCVSNQSLAGIPSMHITGRDTQYASHWQG
jgi:hypothetical protein